MSSWATTRLIAGREIAERLQGRMLRVMTVATAVLVVAGVTIPGLVKGTSKPTRIGLVGLVAGAGADAAAHRERGTGQDRARLRR